MLLSNSVGRARRTSRRPCDDISRRFEVSPDRFKWLLGRIFSTSYYRDNLQIP